MLFAAFGAPAQEAGESAGNSPGERKGERPSLVWDAAGPSGEYLLGVGVKFGAPAAQAAQGPQAVLAYGSVMNFDPFGFNLGVGYRNDSLQAIALYRQDSPGRLPYLDVIRDRQGSLLLLEYTPRAPELRLTLENQLFIGRVHLRHSAEQLALYDLATATLDLLVDYQNRITLVAKLSTIQLLRQAAGAYSVGLSVPMQFHDRTIIVEPRLLHSGTTRHTATLARDLIGYRFGNFSVGRLFGLLDGVRSATTGTTALVMNAEYRLYFLQSLGVRVPIVDGLFLSAFADGGLFWGGQPAARLQPALRAVAGDFTAGGGLGIDWLNFSLTAEAGYNHADAGFVWGIDLKASR